MPSCDGGQEVPSGVLQKALPEPSCDGGQEAEEEAREEASQVPSGVQKFYIGEDDHFPTPLRAGRGGETSRPQESTAVPRQVSSAWIEWGMPVSLLLPFSDAEGVGSEFVVFGGTRQWAPPAWRSSWGRPPARCSS